MIPRIGPVELVLILVIVTMLFGVGKLPEVFGAVGRGIREFRRGAAEDEALTDSQATATETTPDTEAPAAPSAATQTDAQTETTTTTGSVQSQTDT